MYSRTDDYGSERLYGPKRYPTTLKMLSKKVDDVLFGKLQPLDVLTCRVPHRSMPAPEAVQMHVTTAYMYSPEVATAYLMASLDARKAMGLTDCSTGPEVRIFDHLWRRQPMLESVPETQGFAEEWGLVLRYGGMCSMLITGAMLSMSSGKAPRLRMSCSCCLGMTTEDVSGQSP